MKNALVLLENGKGGESVAIQRLIKSYNKKYKSIQFTNILLNKKIDSQKHLGFITDFISNYHYAQEKISRHLSVRKYDFIIGSSYLWMMASISVKQKRTKTIFMFHGLKSAPFFRVFDISYKQIFSKILERVSWFRSDLIIVPSEEGVRYIKKSLLYQINPNRVRVVPNIVPSIFFSKSRLKRQNRNDIYQILYCGRIAKYKGLENLILGFEILTKKISNALLIMAFPSSNVDPIVYKQIDSLIRKYKLQNKIKKILDLNEKDLVKLYSIVDVTILTSEIEFAPLSIVESLATGTPVISTNVGNTGTILRKIDDSLILKDNLPATIYKKLAEYYKYTNLKKMKIKRASRKVAVSYSGSTSLKILDKIFNSF